MMYTLIFCIVFSNIFSFITAAEKTLRNDKPISKKPVTSQKIPQEPAAQSGDDWDFEVFKKKFDPSAVWEKIDKMRKYHGASISDREQIDLMFQHMDQTDELLNLRIGQEHPKQDMYPKDKDGRRIYGWIAPSQPNEQVPQDLFYLRQRLFELMRQAIYQARNKMVIMQNYRDKYKYSGLYKMGFLTNKVDNKCKSFGALANRALRGCILSRETVWLRSSTHQLMSAASRLANQWFSIELLAELIRKNDDICRHILETQTDDVNIAFDKDIIA